MSRLAWNAGRRGFALAQQFGMASDSKVYGVCVRGENPIFDAVRARLQAKLTQTVAMPFEKRPAIERIAHDVLIGFEF